MKITFLGAAGTVTGSKYLLTIDSKKILVDCGLFQGYKELRLRNWAKLPVNPREIDAVILTHAHIDHSGYLPLLVNQGFSGKIYCTHGTQSLCEILLPDSGYLQEEEAHFANKHRYSKHSPALPLYTAEDAKHSLKQFRGCEFGKYYTLEAENISFQFNPAGHILGASTVLITHDNITLVFSGDLGRRNDPIMKPPAPLSQTDYLVLESTYGNRHHENEDPISQLGEIILRTVKRSGTLIIPAFAVGRAQNILYYIYQLKATKRIPDLPVFLDSPMAVSATNLFCHYTQEHRLSKAQCQHLSKNIQFVNTVKESKKLDNIRTSKIIVSASGMATGGRVLHHIKTFGTDPKNMILFTGYQAGGTRGDRLVRGERNIKMLGESVKINAEIAMLHNTSAHADYEEIIQWLKEMPSPPRKIFITHGEPDAAKALKLHIESTLGWNCIIPSYLQVEKF